MVQRPLLPSKSREQMKLAPSLPSVKLLLAKVWAVVDSPVPARPLSQKKRLFSSSFDKRSIRRRTPLLVLSHVPIYHHRGIPRRRRHSIKTDEDRALLSLCYYKQKGGRREIRDEQVALS